MKERHRGGVGGSRGQALLSCGVWREGAPSSWHVGVFTNLEALRTLSFRAFKGGVISFHEDITNYELRLQPLSPPQRWRGETVRWR